AVLALGLEPGPVAGDGRVEVDLAAVGEDQHAQRRHRLRRRPHVDDGVALPRRAGVVDRAAPQVDDELAVEGDGDRRTDVETVVEVGGERIPEGAEPLVARAVGLHQWSSLRWARSGSWPKSRAGSR